MLNSGQKPLGESPAHYGTEAKIARDEAIGGIESSPREQHIAA
jgi:hypothetical protein